MPLARKQLTLTPSSARKKRVLKPADSLDTTASVSNMDESLARLERVVKTEMAAMRSELSSHMTTMCSKIDALASEQKEHKSTLSSHGRRLDTVEQQLVELQDRSRRNNLRLLGLPEGAEKDDMVGYLKKSLPRWLPALLDRDLEIERAHRIYGGASNNAQRPRVVIFKLLRYNDRDLILQAARKHGPIRLEDNATLSFFPDYSPATAKRRGSFAAVRKELRDKGIQSFLQYPATLKVTWNGETKLLQTSEEARLFLQST